SPRSPLFPYTTLFRSVDAAIAQQEVRRRRDVARAADAGREHRRKGAATFADARGLDFGAEADDREVRVVLDRAVNGVRERQRQRSEEHTSELQSRFDL